MNSNPNKACEQGLCDDPNPHTHINPHKNCSCPICVPMKQHVGMFQVLDSCDSARGIHMIPQGSEHCLCGFSKTFNQKRNVTVNYEAVGVCCIEASFKVDGETVCAIVSHNEKNNDLTKEIIDNVKTFLENKRG